MAKLTSLDRILEHIYSDQLKLLRDMLTSEYEEILIQEEILWFQKSRQRWLYFGNRNTAYFHTSTVIKRKYNRIAALKVDDRWISNVHEVKKVARDFYIQLYTEETHDVIHPS